MGYVSRTVASPVGKLMLVASEIGLAAILWENDDPDRVRLGSIMEGRGHPVLIAAERQLAEYFAGERKRFDLPLDFNGTEFQKQVVCAADHPVRRDTKLRGNRAQDRPASRLSRSRCGQWKEPDLDRGAVSPRDRRQRNAHGVRGRAEGQGISAAAGGVSAGGLMGRGRYVTEPLLFDNGIMVDSRPSRSRRRYDDGLIANIARIRI